MKKFIFLALLAGVIFAASSCRKELYNAPDISGVGEDTVTLNIGDKLVLAPNVTNTKGNSYSWWINGKKAAAGQLNYTFEATEAGNFDVAFKVNNKGGAAEQTFKIFVESPITLALADQLAVSMSNVLDIKPTITGPDRDDYTYVWSLGDSVIGKQRDLAFIYPEAGTFQLTLRAAAGKQTTTITRPITVNAATYVKNAYTLLEYLPAPCKGHNWSVIGYADSWKYGVEFPLSYNDYLAKSTQLRKENAANGLVLGSWGGSATFKFDHTVVNAAGKPDLEMTAIYSRLDIPAVYVAYDRNKNGKPDADEWYEIKNEDYGIEDLPDYQVTYSAGRLETDGRRIYNYFNWADNQETPGQGEVQYVKVLTSSMTIANVMSTKGFFPGYYMPDTASKKMVLMDGWASTFTRKGKRISRNVSGAVQFQQKLNIDIDMAVNTKGEFVHLPGIDFIKVQKVVYPFQLDTGVGIVKDWNMEEGRITQVFGILDRHLKN
ncbi:PKD domain-containing protein [Chitinophaga sedimenti]|uniref:PKD-like domain-containing protein n=1 Tax=Chitinophaga sedimenti TaxID=2033606 RepID=UPI00200445A9|nr:PKD-like domain-containing protein [Chitinophaga sedimenti]MCK7555774.1 PKD domain-containing protein [Chitinophaga sedimenti]